MRINRPASLFVSIALLASVVVGYSTTASAAGNPNCDAVDGDYIVSFAPGANVDNEIKNAPGRSISPKFTYDAAINGFAATLNAAQVCAFQKRPNIRSIEMDKEVSTSEVSQSWGLDRIDDVSLPLDNTYDYFSTGSGVTAYVIDTGIEVTHPDFGGRAKLGYSAVGGKATDCNGHGTHVAGTIGGTKYGVAKRVNLVAVKVLNCAGSGTNSGVIAGINWVIKNHPNATAAVANMSLGGGFSQAINNAVANLVADNVTVALAAGNENVDACSTSPASTPTAITVAASTSADLMASFSNYGNCVDLIAPGVGITSAWLKSGTNTISGTSMAAPHVAGLAARYLQGNPNAQPAVVGDALKANSKVSILGSPNATPYSLVYSAPTN